MRHIVAPRCVCRTTCWHFCSLIIRSYHHFWISCFLLETTFMQEILISVDYGKTLDLTNGETILRLLGWVDPGATYAYATICGLSKNRQASQDFSGRYDKLQYTMNLMYRLVEHYGFSLKATHLSRNASRRQPPCHHEQSGCHAAKLSRHL